MTPEAINITIAEHLGAKLVQSLQTKEVFLTFEPQKFSHPTYWKHLDSWPLDEVYLELGVPNYAGDLNAIRDAELTLWREEETVEEYRETLQNVYLKAVGYSGCGYWFMSGPYQRAEAFLRTVGKWKEEA